MNIKEGYLKTQLVRKDDIKSGLRRNIVEGLIVGWVLTDGSLEKNRVNISQNERELLIKIQELIVANYNIKNKISITKDKNSLRLRVHSIGFRKYLTNKYEIPVSKKAGTIRVPEKIRKSDRNVKIGFLAACLEGDGSFSTYRRITRYGKYRVPRISFESKSEFFVKDIKEILDELKIDSKINKDLTYYKLEVIRVKDCVKLFFEIFPFMIHYRKIKAFKKSMSNPIVLNTIRIKGLGNLIKKWEIKSGKTLVEFSNLIEKKCKYTMNPYTLDGWLCNQFSAPMWLILKTCEEIGESYFNYIPEYFAGILWVHRKISLKDFKRLRGLNEFTRYPIHSHRRRTRNPVRKIQAQEHGNRRGKGINTRGNSPRAKKEPIDKVFKFF